MSISQSSFGHLEIETHAPTYLPGSLITGHVKLQTTHDVLCTGIQLAAHGTSQCLKKSQTWEYTHLQRGITLFSGRYSTEMGVRHQNHVHFATDMAPDGGNLVIPFSNCEKKMQMQLIGETEGTEQILGVAKFSPHSVINNCRSKKEMLLPLTLDGATVTTAVRFRAAWHTNTDGEIQELHLQHGAHVSRMVQLDIAHAELRELPNEIQSYDQFRCRVIVESDATQNDGALIKLSPTDIQIPFQFKLPKHLPTSIDSEDAAVAVNYALRCDLPHADLPFPSAICKFGVTNSPATNTRAAAPSQTTQQTRPSYIPCIAPHRTQAQMTTSLNRSMYVPSMPLEIHIQGRNALHTPVAVRVDLVRVHHLKRAPKEKPTTIRAVFNLIPPVGIMKKKKFFFDWSIPFPRMPSTYYGRGHGKESLSWEYQIEVTIEAKEGAVILHHCMEIDVTDSSPSPATMDIPIKSRKHKHAKAIPETSRRRIAAVGADA